MLNRLWNKILGWFGLPHHTDPGPNLAGTVKRKDRDWLGRYWFEVKGAAPSTFSVKVNKETWNKYNVGDHYPGSPHL